MGRFTNHKKLTHPGTMPESNIFKMFDDFFLNSLTFEEHRAEITNYHENDSSGA